MVPSEITTNLIVPLLTAGEFVKFLRYGILIIMGLYVVYAFIMLRQIDLMNRSFHTPLAGFFKLLGYIHFLLALLVIFAGILAI